MFQEVKSLDADTTVALGGFNKKARKDNPTSAEGYFLGSKKVASPKSKTGYAYIHVLQTPKGNLGVWGKTDMDRKLLSVTPGMMIRITHTGMQPTPNGEMYKYKVEVDSDNTIDVGDLTAAAANDTDSNSSEESDAVEYDETGEDEAEAAQAAALLAAERKAKVQALLNKSAKK